MPAWSPDIVEIGDRIAALTVLQASELGEYMEHVHGIKPQTQEAPPQKEPPPREVKAPEQTEFTVVLESFDAAKKIGVIKVLREVSGLAIKEAKDFVEAAPKPIRENMSKEEAEKIKTKMEEAGAVVSLK